MTGGFPTGRAPCFGGVRVLVVREELLEAVVRGLAGQGRGFEVRVICRFR